jgi:hypothetical protein
MKAFLFRFATPLVIGFFVVSAVSGIGLFLHIAPKLFHEMHEILSMVFLLAFALHLWRNWESFGGYVKRGTVWVPLAIALVACVPFVLEALEEGEQRESAAGAARLMTEAPLSELAPLLNTTPQGLVETLGRHGHRAASAETSLAALASMSGASTSDLLRIVLPAR